jgi:hypothetical protein
VMAIPTRYLVAVRRGLRPATPCSTSRFAADMPLRSDIFLASVAKPFFNRQTWRIQ